MKLHTNKKYNTIALYAIIVIAVNVLIVLAVFKLNGILNILGKFVSVIMPLIWGMVIAFLMNPVMVTTERIYKRFIREPKHPGAVRALSVTVAAAIFLGIIAGVVAVVIPELINSSGEVVETISTLPEKGQRLMDKLLSNYPKAQEFIMEKIVNFTTDVSNIQPMLENILNGALSFVGVLYDFALGFIVSLYLLYSKEKFIAQTKKMIFANFKRPTAEKILNFGADANKIFSGFISGKIIDSIIIGFLCFVILTIFGMPYNLLISVIVGITNIIPFFGPVIGAIPSGFLMLMVDPGKVIWLLLIIFLLQQFDGNVLGPKILGDSTGLPAIWVMIAIFVCGGLFGFAGMLVGVPTFALLYKITKENIEAKLKRKKMPVNTQYYIDNDKNLTAAKVRKQPLTLEELEAFEIPSADEINEAVDRDEEPVSEEATEEPEPKDELPEELPSEA
ncbi:MAG: AI-2E family transporter [Ruminococcus sp.]|nr:AI-2E family transporter [Ruminococcus sp.]